MDAMGNDELMRATSILNAMHVATFTCPAAHQLIISITREATTPSCWERLRFRVSVYEDPSRNV